MLWKERTGYEMPGGNFRALVESAIRAELTQRGDELEACATELRRTIDGAARSSWMRAKGHYGASVFAAGSRAYFVELGVDAERSRALRKKERDDDKAREQATAESGAELTIDDVRQCIDDLRRRGFSVPVVLLERLALLEADDAKLAR